MSNSACNCLKPGRVCMPIASGLKFKSDKFSTSHMIYLRRLLQMIEKSRGCCARKKLNEPYSEMCVFQLVVGEARALAKALVQAILHLYGPGSARLHVLTHVTDTQDSSIANAYNRFLQFFGVKLAVFEPGDFFLGARDPIVDARRIGILI